MGLGTQMHDQKSRVVGHLLRLEAAAFLPEGQGGTQWDGAPGPHVWLPLAFEGKSDCVGL